jgi:transcriptional regulator GlxA family with amidase domain
MGNGRTIGILIFDAVEEMDFVGPWEVLKAAADKNPQDRVVTIAPKPGLVLCEKGMRVLPDHVQAEAPPIDVLVIPGGSGARREANNPATVDWLLRTAPVCKWVCSVCTGAFLLVGAGLAEGRKVTTHHDFLNELRRLGSGEVLDGVRFVVDGHVVTAAGVMSGIEMSLWLVGRLYGSETEHRTRRYIAYDDPPRGKLRAG